MVTMNPYVHYNAQCEEAMKFYKSVFGGELELSRFGETSEEFKDQIMHAVLKTDDFRLMASDSGPQGIGTVGENISISLSGDDKEKLTGYFDGLSEGGKVTQPLKEHPWGAVFGMLIDKFDIHWLVNIDH
jgi:PhnB protein